MTGKSEESVILSYLELSDFMTRLANLASDYISHLPTDDQLDLKLIKFTYDFWARDRRIVKAVSIPAQISARAPEKAISVFLRILPDIDENGDTMPQSSDPSRICFCSKMSAVDWSNKRIRLVVRLIGEISFSCFCRALVERAESFSAEGTKLILDAIFSMLRKNESVLSHKLHVVTAHHVSRLVADLSLRHEQVVFEYFLKVFSNVSSKQKWELTASLLVFVAMKFGSGCQIQKLQGVLKQIYQATKHVPPTEVLHTIAVDCVLNLCGSILSTNESLANSKLLFRASKYAKHFQKLPGYVGPAHSLRALLYNFSKHKKLARTLPQYCKKYIEPVISKPEYGNCILQTFTLFLRGKHYEDPILMKDKGSNYQWMPSEKCDAAFIKYMVDTIVAHPATFAKSQYLLSRFFLQYAAFDFGAFLKETFPIFLSDDFQRIHRRSFFLFLQEVFSTSDFRINAEQLEEVKKASFPVVEKCLEEMNQRTNVSTTNSACNCLSFHQSLLLYDNDFAFAMKKLLDDSWPTVPQSRAPKILVPLAKWQKAMGVTDRPGIFTANASSIDFILDRVKQPKEYVLVLSISPFYDFNEALIRKLCVALLSRSTRIAVVALRALEALIIKNRRGEDVIVGIVEEMTKPSVIRKEQTYNILYALCQICEIMVQYKLPLEDISIVDFPVIFGLSSSCHLVRMLAVKLGNLAKECYSGSSLSVIDILQSKEGIISADAQRDILHMIAPLEKIPCELPDLSFMTVAESNNTVLFQCYFARLAKECRGVLPSLETLHTKTMDMFQSLPIEECDLYQMVSLLVFMINASDGGARDHVKEYQKFVEQMSMAIQMLESVRCDSFSSMYMNLDESLWDVVFSGVVGDSLLNYAVSVHFMCFTTRQTELRPTIIKYLDHLLDYVLSTEVVSTKMNGESNLGPLVDYQQLSETITNVLIAGKRTCDSMYHKYKEWNRGPFCRVHRCLVTDIDLAKWWPFVFNVSKIEMSWKTVAHATLASMFLISAPPDDVAQLIFDQMQDFPPKTMASILSRYFIRLFPEFVSIAFTNNPKAGDFFIAICRQFLLFDNVSDMLTTMDKNWNGKDLSTQELDEQQIIFANVGSIIALCLHSLTENSESMRVTSARLLTAIFTSCSLVIDEPSMMKTIEEQAARTEALVGRELMALYRAGIRQASEFACEHFSFCSEQFVKGMLALISFQRPGVHVLFQMLVPWITDIHMNSSDFMVLKQSDPIFHEYTPYTFMVDILKAPSYYLLYDTITANVDCYERFLVLLLKMRSENENTRNVISHFLTRNPTDTCKLVMPILTLDYWFFRVIQMGDASLEIDPSSVVIQPVKSTEVIGESIDEYTDMCEFVIEALMSVSFDNSSILEEHLPIILSFILVTSSDYSDDVLSLLSVFLKSKRPRDISEEMLTAFITNLEPTRQEQFGFLCLKWGLCCGDLRLATKALKLYCHAGLPASLDMIDPIIRNIYIVHSLMTDRSDNVDLELGYIAACLGALRNILALRGIRCDIFWTCVSLLSVKSCEIVDACLDLIRLICTNSSVDDILKLMPSDFPGVITWTCRSTFTVKSLPVLYDLFTFIVTSNAYRLAYPDKRNCLVIMAAIMNGMLVTGQKDMSIFKLMLPHIEDKMVRKVFSIIVDSETEATPEERVRFSVGLLRLLEEDDVQLIMDALARIVTVLGGKGCAPFYNFFTHAIEAGLNPRFFAASAKVAANDKHVENTLSRSMFLRIFTEKNGSIIEDHCVRRVDYAIFVASTVDLRLGNWHPEPLGDPLASIATLPPLYVKYPEYKSNRMLDSINIATHRVLTVPFARWSEFIFCTKSIQKPEKPIINQNQYHFTVDFKDFMDISSSSSTSDSTSESEETTSTSEEVSVIENLKSFSILDIRDFVPSMKFVEKISRLAIT